MEEGFGKGDEMNGIDDYRWQDNISLELSLDILEITATYRAFRYRGLKTSPPPAGS